MQIDDRARRDLYGSAEEALGRRGADVLMAHLPPVGWADVATKQDVAVVVQRMDGLERRMDRFDERLAGFDDRLAALHRSIVTAVVGSVLAATTVSLGAAHFV